MLVARHYASRSKPDAVFAAPFFCSLPMKRQPVLFRQHQYNAAFPIHQRATIQQLVAPSLCGLRGRDGTGGGRARRSSRGSFSRLRHWAPASRMERFDRKQSHPPEWVGTTRDHVQECLGAHRGGTRAVALQPVQYSSYPPSSSGGRLQRAHF